MNYKRIAIIVFVLAAATAAYLRLRPGAPEPAKPASKSPAPTAKKTRSQRTLPGKRSSPEPSASARVEMDDDPQGALLLEGQVVDDQGLSLAGAIVRINANPKRTTLSDKDGSFRFDKLVGRSYVLWAQQGAQIGGPLTHRLTDSSDPAVIRTRRGANVIVSVVAKADAKAIGGASVTIEGGAEPLKSTSDAQGKARFQGVGRGFSSVAVNAKGYALTRQLAQIPDNIGGAPFEISVSLEKGAVVSGTVVDEDGKAVSGARVLAIDVSALISLSNAKKHGAVTDEQGRFTSAALAAGNYRFAAHKSGYRPSSSEAKTTDGKTETAGIAIVLKRGRRLSGRVVNDRTQPVAWAAVRVRPEEKGLAGGGAIRQVIADEGGNFEMQGLHSEMLSVMAEGKEASSPVLSVDLRQSSKADLQLVLSVKGSISGSVVDSKGEPVAEVQVTARPDIFAKGPTKGFALRGGAAQITDGGGHFTFRGLPDGKYRLRASRVAVRRGGNVEKGVLANTGDENVELKIESPGGVKGKLVYANGEPVRSFTVTIGFPPGVPVTSEAGQFKIESVPPGSYDIRFGGIDFAPLTKRDQIIKAGALTDMGSITISRGQSVVGRVVDKNGAAVAGANVFLAKQLLGDGKNVVINLGKGVSESFALKSTKTDTVGRFIFLGAGKAERLIIADHPEKGRSLPQTLNPETKATTVELALKPFGRLAGKVLLAGTPTASIAVIVTPKTAQKQNLVVKTADDGSFLVERLPEGVHTVMAMSGGGVSSASAGKTVTVEAGKETRADINIEVGSVNLTVKVEGKAGAKIQLAQVFLFKGNAVNPTTGKEIQSVYLAAGGGAKMAFAMGTGDAKFSKITAASYSICTLPIEGDMADVKFKQRLQAYAAKLRVYCERYTAPASPLEQTTTVVVPPMEPLPDPE